MRLLNIFLGLFGVLSGLFAVLIFIKVGFELQFNLRWRGISVDIPKDWVVGFVFLGISFLCILISTIAGSEKISKKLKVLIISCITIVTITTITIAIIEDENKYNEFYKYGNVKYDNGDYEGAIIDFNKAIELSVNEPHYYYRRGQAKRDSGRLNDALIDFDKAIELRPEYSSAFYMRGRLKISLNEIEDGCIDLHKAKMLGFELEDYDLEICPN